MKANVLFIFSCLIFLCHGAMGQAANEQNNNVIRQNPATAQMDFVSGVILVKFKDAVPARSKIENGLRKVGVTSVDALLAKYEARKVEKLFPSVQPLSQKKLLKTYAGKVIEQPSLHNIYKIELSDPNGLAEAIEAFKEDPSVEFAEPNYIYSIVADQPVSDVLTEDDVKRMAKTSVTTPDDPLYPQQSYIPAIHADEVWDSTQGDTSQVIGILDTGVDWLHPDLKNKIWVNEAEANGVSGVDDDGNGFVDDVRGWDFINNENDPTDDNSHGTHVAGIAAAEANNGIGIAGVSWYAKILPIKVFQSSGRGDAATISQGIIYAANKGATVINMSFGSYARSLTMESALANAYASCILVAAAGNDGLPIGPPPPPTAKPFYPAALSYVLGVQAGDAMGPEGFSNYDQDGPIYSRFTDLFNYELKAPGSGIISTIPNGNYRVYSGTSMASPIVSGAVSLYKAIFPEQSQELMWGNLINTSAAHMNIYAALSVSPHPILAFVSNTIVDTLAGNNKNGYVDAGETIQLWFTVRNTWGQSDSVLVGLRLGEFEDTSTASILNPKILIGSISSYAKRTNEANPFIIQFNQYIAHDRDVVFEALLWSHDGSDTVRQSITLNVNNGQNLAGVMDTTLVLTADRLWIVNQSFRISANGKLIINAGTTIELNNLIVNRGQIFSNGTADSNIIFKGGGFRDVGSFTFLHTQFLSTNDGFGDNSIFGGGGNYAFDHCIFDGITANTWISSLFLGGPFSFSHCIFRNCTFSVLNYIKSPSFYKCNVDNCFTYINGYANYQNFFPGSYNNFNRLFSSYSNGQPTSMVFPINTDTSSIGNNFISYGKNSFAVYAQGSKDIITISNQYWGTTQSSTINGKIFDFWDDPNLPLVNFEPYLTTPSDSAHGIVWKVLVNGVDPQDEHLDPIGVGTHRYDVYFNREMDTAYTPQLSFGVREPYTQQAVADSGRWSPDHKIWTAYKTIKLHTGDGINRVRVSGARDLEKFEIPIERQRFEFVIDAAGSASTEFTATPGLGKINLEWNNTDLTDLLGFNMYRFTNVTDTTYTDTTLINTTLITDTLYTDYDVIPGKNYYYKYKVVRTDFSESDYSRTVGTKALTSSPGDANGDLSVDVLDVVSTVSYILGQNPQPFIFSAADVKNDTAINVLDVVGIINIILHPDGVAALSKNADGLARLDLTGNTITLTTNAPVSAIQFRLQGKGLKDLQFTPDASIAQFEAASNALGDSARMFVIYNLKGTTLGTGTYALGRFSPLPPLVDLTEGIVADAQGRNIVTSIYENGQPLIPDVYYLSQNFPNPFNLSTRIQFGVPEKAKAKIVLYNVLGQRVKIYDLGERVPGRYEITWNGVNERGNTVSSGVYFYRFESDKFTLTKKLVLIK